MIAPSSGPTQESEVGETAFGEGDLIGTVGSATLSAEEIVRRLDTLDLDELRQS